MSPLSIAALIDASPSQKQMRPVAFAAPFFVGFTLLSMKLVSGLVTSSVSADAIESLRVITQPDAQIARAAAAMSFFIFVFAFLSVDLSMRPDNATPVAPQTRTSLDRFSTIIPFSAITCTRSQNFQMIAPSAAPLRQSHHLEVSSRLSSHSSLLFRA